MFSAMFQTAICEVTLTYMVLIINFSHNTNAARLNLPDRYIHYADSDTGQGIRISAAHYH
jgi:hypothetical protein